MSVMVQAMSGAASGPAISTRGPSLSSQITDGDRRSELHSKLSIPPRPQQFPPMSSSPQTRTSRFSFITSARSTGLATVFANTKLLACLLDFLSWTDLHSLSGASRAIRRIFLDANVKETVFSHFVPGYRTALRLRDRRLWEDSIRMNYEDLGLLMHALDTPLHRYPMHALSVVSSDLPTWEQMQTTKRFQAFCQVHSRVVLLLQNLVHSNARPVPSDLDKPQLRPNGSGAQAGLRELTFPAPLSYADIDFANGKSHSSKSCPPSVGGDTAIHSSTSSLKLLTPKSQKRHNGKWGSESGASESDVGKTRRDRRTSRLSIFGKNSLRSPLPQPATEPESLRLYSGTWRRSHYAPPSADDEELKPPKRRFASSRYSSNSSLSSPSPSSSRQSATPNSSSPHDFYAAARRNRAPILRVFVPCMAFTDEILSACEDLLIDCGLWEHMSVGDVVCNFGYVPLVDEVDDGTQEKDHRRWLVFTGQELEIYHPTRPPPITGALSLPSPFYYTHILPPFVNPRLCLTLPPFHAHFSLTPLTTRVSSPHAQGGYARVKTFAWIANFDARPAPGSPMSSGWAGEWVLQGEGTPEGKIQLQNALRGGQVTEHEYEIMLENSGGGKLWLKMVSSVPGARTSNDMDLRT